MREYLPGLPRVAALLLLVAGGATQAEEGLPGESSTWSQPTEGLRTRFVSDREVYEEGDYIWLYLDVLNATDAPVELAWGSGLENRLQLVGRDAKVIEMRRKGPSENVGVRALAPRKQVPLMLFYICGNDAARYAPLGPGRYRAVWPATAEERVKDAHLAPGCEVTFQVVPGKVRPTPPGSGVTEVPWGRRKEGLQTRIRCPRNKFYAGEPIPVTVELRNVSDKVLRYSTSFRAANNKLAVLDARNRPVPYTNWLGSTSCSTLPLEPRQVAVLGAIDLSAFYFLRRPDEYSVRWLGAKALNFGRFFTWPGTPEDTGKTPARPQVGRDAPVRATEGPDGKGQDAKEPDIPGTNRFRFEVLSSEHNDPFDAALAVLLENRPAGWDVVMRPSVSRVSRPGHQWSRVPARHCCFRHQDMYRDHRLDQLQIAPVSFWLAAEMAVEEPWDAQSDQEQGTTEYLGRGDFGHLYLFPLQKSSLRHWPAVKEDLLKWLAVRPLP